MIRTVAPFTDADAIVQFVFAGFADTADAGGFNVPVWQQDVVNVAIAVAHRTAFRAFMSHWMVPETVALDTVQSG